MEQGTDRDLALTSVDVRLDHQEWEDVLALLHEQECIGCDPGDWQTPPSPDPFCLPHGMAAHRIELAMRDVSRARYRQTR